MLCRQLTIYIYTHTPMSMYISADASTSKPDEKKGKKLSRGIFALSH